MTISKKKLRIAHIAPLFAPVPPRKYGGTERVVDWLIREQVDAGHEVSLFASGDSITRAKLIPVVPRALWKAPGVKIYDIYHTIELDMVDKMSDEFDIIHSHFNFIHFQSLNRLKIPMVTTLHWRVDLREFQDLYRYFDKAPLVAISHTQADFIPHANVADVVYHGLPIKDFPADGTPENYIAFVGRFSPEKGVHTAIEVSRRTGIPLKIAAKLPTEGTEVDYFENKIKPMIKEADVELLGELNDKEKSTLYKNAKVTLIPTNWPEPFGLVTIESLCSGTPVIACPVGCTKEIVIDGEVGFTAMSAGEMVEAVKKIDQIDRAHCRKYVEEKFCSQVMARNYDKVYHKLLEL